MGGADMRKTVDIRMNTPIQSTSEDCLEKQTAVFGDDMGLFISTLYNFYQIAGFEAKREFLKMVKEDILHFEKELLMSLGAFL